ncbi:MAG: MFS transporter [Planctomycetota bacterium]|jgi:MFS family permease
MMKDERQEHSWIAAAASLSTAGRCLVLLAAFLGWTFAGTQMALTTLVMRPATIDLLGLTGPLDTADEAIVGQWLAWSTGAFLLGAAAGGLVFGWIGDRLGRARALGLSILCFSVFSGATYSIGNPAQLMVLRVFVGLGVGGTWPNGVALVSEAWPNASRPMLAGVMGAAANVGLGAMSAIGMQIDIQPADWRWTMLVGAVPGLLALLVFVLVPESPRWLADRAARRSGATGGLPHRSPVLEVFRLPLLKITLIGIALGTVPLIGGWGSANWIVHWADQVGTADATRADDDVDADDDAPDYSLKATTQFWRSIASIAGSLLGGWAAGLMGRRRLYFLVSLGALLSAQYLFRSTEPGDRQFMVLVAALGLFNGMYFGWLPLFLPELFPTRVRSTGAGVCYNFGRILTTATVLATGAVMLHFGGNYARIGTITSFIFAVGMVVILLAPDTARKQMED